MSGACDRGQPAGTYKAWLSSDSASVVATFSHATLPYYMPNDALLANNFADLIDSTILRAFHVDEHERRWHPIFPGRDQFQRLGPARCQL